MEQFKRSPQSQRKASNTAVGAHAAHAAHAQLMGHNHRHSRKVYRTGDLHQDPLKESELTFELNRSNIGDFLGSKPNAIIMFYSSHDHQDNHGLRVGYAHAANKHKMSHAYGYVDCSKDQQLCQYFGVKTNPSYLAFRNGQSKTEHGVLDPRPYL